MSMDDEPTRNPDMTSSDTDAAPEIWFLTGSQALYGEDVLNQVAAQSRQVAGDLAEGIDALVRIQWRPVLADSTDIRAVMAEANSDDSCVGVIAWMHTF